LILKSICEKSQVLFIFAKSDKRSYLPRPLLASGPFPDILDLDYGKGRGVWMKEIY
jgi:hypothetical protein